MKISFRKIKNQKQFQKTVEFLIDDVEKNNGTISEIIDIYGILTKLTVCNNYVLNDKFQIVRSGTILINEEVSNFEAWAWSIQDI